LPLGTGECARVAISQYVPNQETQRRIEEALGPMAPLPDQHDSDESRNYRLPGAAGSSD